MYWLLSNELVDEDRDADLSGNFTTNLGDDMSFDDGEQIPFPITQAIYSLMEPLNGRLTDHLSISEIPGLVLSNKVCQLLESLKISNFQRFPLTIFDTEKKEIAGGYSIVNVIGVVDCVDQDVSDLEYYDDGDIEFIDKLVLKEENIPEGADIFRLARRTTLVIVSQKLKDAIEQAAMTGFVFYKPEDYA